MKIELNNIVVLLDSDIQEVIKLCALKAGIKESDILNYKIKRRSTDARRSSIKFNYSIILDIKEGTKYNSNIKEFVPKIRKEQVFGTEKLRSQPIIIGAGPAGLFCAYFLAKNGFKPVIYEQGSIISQRVCDIENFISTQKLNLNSNIQFGEGGAGTFSDGKLTARSGDELSEDVLQIFVDCGANEEILYLSKPHIGTDMLRNVITNLRCEIEKLGGTFYFNKKLENIVIKNDKVLSIFIDDDEIKSDALVLAIGHSARDTYEMLYEKQVFMSPKPFAIGVRIENKQDFINNAQYGKFANHKSLKAADYKLAYNGAERSCFSFCMCPGGTVVAAASEQHGVVVNGMSNNARDGENANSALVVNVKTTDFDGVLGGIAFQRKFEQSAYKITNSYAAPVQNTVDFLNGRKSTKIININPTYPLGVEPADISACLPDFVSKTIAEGLRCFNKQISGFSSNSVLTGVETRTSAPVRIERNENMESINVKGLYPIGEGAGYAGGIMSAAIDGIKTAQAIMQKYSL